MKKIWKTALNAVLTQKWIPWTAAVVVAAGNSERMQGTDKISALIGNQPVIVHAVRALQECSHIREIVIVTRADRIETVERWMRIYGMDKVCKVLEGGKTRAQSVRIGLDAISRKARFVAVHDGARPFPTAELVEETVRAAVKFGAAAPALPLKDTVKEADGGFVIQTPDRSRLYAVQTPQVFDADLLRGSYVKAAADGFTTTDDCSVVEYFGMSVYLTSGSEENLKITTPLDLKIAELILRQRQEKL